MADVKLVSTAGTMLKNVTALTGETQHINSWNTTLINILQKKKKLLQKECKQIWQLISVLYETSFSSRKLNKADTFKLKKSCSFSCWTPFKETDSRARQQLFLSDPLGLLSLVKHLHTCTLTTTVKARAIYESFLERVKCSTKNVLPSDLRR